MDDLVCARRYMVATADAHDSGPSAKHSDASADDSEPSAKGSDASADDSEPSAKGSDASADDSEPSAKESDASADDAEPSADNSVMLRLTVFGEFLSLPLWKIMARIPKLPAREKCLLSYFLLDLLQKRFSATDFTDLLGCSRNNLCEFVSSVAAILIELLRCGLMQEPYFWRSYR